MQELQSLLESDHPHSGSWNVPWLYHNAQGSRIGDGREIGWPVEKGSPDRRLMKGRTQGDKLTHCGSEGCAGDMKSERREGRR